VFIYQSINQVLFQTETSIVNSNNNKSNEVVWSHALRL